MGNDRVQILVNHKHINLNNGSYQIAGLSGLSEITRQQQNLTELHIKVSCFNFAGLDGRMCSEV